MATPVSDTIIDIPSLLELPFHELKNHIVYSHVGEMSVLCTVYDDWKRPLTLVIEYDDEELFNYYRDEAPDTFARFCQMCHWKPSSRPTYINCLQRLLHRPKGKETASDRVHALLTFLQTSSVRDYFVQQKIYQQLVIAMH